MAIVSSSSRSQLQLYFDLFEIDKFFSAVIAKEDADDQKSMTKPYWKRANGFMLLRQTASSSMTPKTGLKPLRK
jgi:hypothetical protein